ncbi:uncharacterized protein ACR2FA_002307 [Aphomia sociella]
MIFKYSLILFVTVVCIFGEKVSSDEDYMDAVISLLLNGDNVDFIENGDKEDEDTPVLTGGVWKCGDCADVNDSMLIYSESNDVDSDLKADEVDIQIGLVLPNMKCVTVRADVPGVVKRMAGACRGESVTLTVAPAQHFTVNVYSN